jgi:ABC-2 type transport system permease protein
MSEVFAAAVKDLRRYSRDPLALTLWLGIPLFLGGLMIFIVGGDNGPAPRVHLLIVDEDDTFGSRLLLGMFNRGQMEMIDAESVDAAEGRERLDRGEASALLLIPEGFTDAVLREEPAKIELVTNPARRIAPGIVEELLSLLRDAVFYAHRLLGPQIREMVTGPPDGQYAFRDQTISEMSVAINRTVTRLQRYLDPPVIELETAKPEKEEPQQQSADSIPFSFYFLPGMLMMGFLFAAQGLSDDIWRERESGALRRVLTTPLGVSRFLVGKVAAATVILAVIALVALLAGFWYFELPWLRLPLAWVWSIGTGCLLLGLMFSVQVFASSHRGASILSFLVIFPLMMLGGSMFPLELMPGWLATMGKFTPNGWAVEQLKAILLARQGPLPTETAFGFLLVVTVGFFAVAGFRIARGFARS